jgi:hypothetical protein
MGSVVDYRQIRSSSSAAQCRCDGTKNNLPLLQTHSWKISFLLGAGFDVGIAVGSMGITTELASRRTDPTSDLNEMSFNETIFILPPRDSRWTPCGPWSSNDRVGDSSLRKKTK